MPRIRMTCLAIFLAAGTACAGVENAGTTAGNFLSVGTGASVLSMGGAVLGTGDDLHAAAWNPAALARLNTTQFAISHSTLAEQSSQDLAAAGGRLGRGSTRWAANLLYQGEGGFDGRDAANNATGGFNVSSMAFGLQFAHPLGEAVTAGLGGRWLSDNLGDTKGTGFALDLGLQARTGPFGIGIAARNVGGSMTYSSAGRFDLPAVYGIGAAWSDAAHGLRLALDANFPHAYYNDVRIGGEWRWEDRVALRAGYRMELGAASGEPLGGPSFGMGAGANGVWVDYAFLAGNADAQGRHRLGLTFHPGILNGRMHPMADGQPGDAAPAQREAVAVATPSVTREPVAVAPAPAPVAPALVAVAVKPVPVTPAPVVVVAAPAVPAPPTVDVAKRLPPGGSESEARPRDAMPASALAASRPVRVAPLAVAKPTGSIGDNWVAAVPAAAPAAVAPVIVAPPVVVAAPAAAPLAAAPASTGPSIVAPSIVAPAIAPPVAAAPAPARALAANHPVRPRIAPVVKPVVPAVSAPAAAPESVSAPPAPQAAPSEPQRSPDEAAPEKKTSPWPTVSAVLPKLQLAGSSPRVTVVSVPADAPSTAPITKSAGPAPRPTFVLVVDGETLDSIAKRWDTTVPALMMENNLVNQKLKRGQKLLLPQPQHH